MADGNAFAKRRRDVDALQRRYRLRDFFRGVEHQTAWDGGSRHALGSAAVFGGFFFDTHLFS